MLELTARQHGAQPFDVRPGAKAREPLDLSAHLEEAAAPVAKAEAATQADALLPRPPSPDYESSRSKSGVDAGTQVPHGSLRRLRPGERLADGNIDAPLFDFDDEVAPLVETLAERALWQAGEELAHELQLRALAARREELEAALAADAQREASLVAAAKEAAARRAALKAAAREDYDRQIAALERVAALHMARGALAQALGTAFGDLRAAGAFRDPEADAVRAEVLPGLYASVSERLGDAAAVRDGGGLLEALLAGALEAAAESTRSRRAAEAAREAELSKRYLIRVYVRLPRRQEDVEAELAAGGGEGFTTPGEDAVEVEDSEEGGGAGGEPALHYRTVIVGPLPVTKRDSIASLETAIAAWLEGKNSRHTRRVLAMAGEGARLALHIGRRRLPPTSRLLDSPLSELAGLELRPVRGGGDTGEKERESGWDLSVPEETLPGPEGGAAGEAES